MCALALLVAAVAPRIPLSAIAPARLTGVVTLTSSIKTPLASATYASRRVEVPESAVVQELANVVVFVKGAPYDGALPVSRATILQQDESFLPRLVAITRGSSVDFPNGDPYFHDVFSLSKAAAFDLGSYPKGKSRSRRFDKAGLVKVFCHIHSDMSASIMVFDHPYFAIPRPDGTFSIDGLPPGEYQVSAWHERIGENTRTVRLQAGRTAEIRFSLPVVQCWRAGPARRASSRGR